MFGAAIVAPTLPEVQAVSRGAFGESFLAISDVERHQAMYNYACSIAVEIAALEPRSSSFIQRWEDDGRFLQGNVWPVPECRQIHASTDV